jgi:hypothetical protein
MLASIEFLADLPLYKHTQPYELYAYPNNGSHKESNCEFKTAEIEVSDIRGKHADYSIANNSFTIVKQATKCVLDASVLEKAPEGNEVVNEYLKETMEIVKENLGGTKVICFDWRVCRSLYKFEPLKHVNPSTDNRKFSFAAMLLLLFHYLMLIIYDIMRSQLAQQCIQVC